MAPWFALSRSVAGLLLLFLLAMSPLGTAGSRETEEKIVTLVFCNLVPQYILLVDVMVDVMENGKQTNVLHHETVVLDDSYYDGIMAPSIRLGSIAKVQEMTNPRSTSKVTIQFNIYKIQSRDSRKRLIQAVFVAYQIREVLFSQQLRNYILKSKFSIWPETTVQWTLETKINGNSTRKKKAKLRKEKRNGKSSKKKVTFQTENDEAQLETDNLQLVFTINEFILSPDLLHLFKLDDEHQEWTHTNPEGFNLTRDFPYRKLSTPQKNRPLLANGTSVGT